MGFMFIYVGVFCVTSIDGRTERAGFLRLTLFLHASSATLYPIFEQGCRA